MQNPLLRVLRVAGVAAFAATTFACGSDTTEPQFDDGPLTALVPGTQVITGEVGPGAQYALYLPPEWNGDLVLFMKGFDNGTVPAIPSSSAGLRDGLLAEGYGFGWTSNSQTRMAIDDQVTRTRQLYGLFTEQFGRPEHAYLMGFSLGSTATMRLVQSNDGNKFDGAVAMCGPVGGLPLQVSYYMNVLVLFEYFFPGVVAATPVQPATFNATAVNAAIAANLAAAAELAGLDQTQMQYTSDTELASAIRNPVMFASADWFTGDILLRTGGKPFFDNRGVVYSGSSNDAALNDGVARYAAAKAALNQVMQWYSPDGRLRKPVITLHTVRDPVVPLWHETALAQLVAAAGTEHLLLQRTFDRPNHCQFTVPEQVTALTDLAAWVETGVKPTQ